LIFLSIINFESVVNINILYMLKLSHKRSYANLSAAIVAVNFE
jgi:hypothetical protein